MSVDDKFEKVYEKLDVINDTLLRNTISLETHEKRTRLAEGRIDKVESDLKPLQSSLTFVLNIIKFIAAAGAIILFAKQLGII